MQKLLLPRPFFNYLQSQKKLQSQSSKNGPSAIQGESATSSLILQRLRIENGEWRMRFTCNSRCDTNKSKLYLATMRVKIASTVKARIEVVKPFHAKTSPPTSILQLPSMTKGTSQFSKNGPFAIQGEIAMSSLILQRLRMWRIRCSNPYFISSSEPLMCFKFITPSLPRYNSQNYEFGDQILGIYYSTSHKHTILGASKNILKIVSPQ